MLSVIVHFMRAAIRNEIPPKEKIADRIMGSPTLNIPLLPTSVKLQHKILTGHFSDLLSFSEN